MITFMNKDSKLHTEKEENNKQPQLLDKEKEYSSNTSPPLDHMLYLQRTLGNQQMIRMFETGTPQAKLTISQPGDVYEQEADRMADFIMDMPKKKQQNQIKENNDKLKKHQETSNTISQHPLKEKHELQINCDTEAIEEQMPEESEQEQKYIRLKNAASLPSEIDSKTESTIQKLKGSGQPLPSRTRSFFESYFDYDFSQVRIHNDAWAYESAKTINARAYTLGNDIAFAHGEYAPSSTTGKKLLAHELIHMVQQIPNQVSRKADDTIINSAIAKEISQEDKKFEDNIILIKNELLRESIIELYHAGELENKKEINVLLNDMISTGKTDTDLYAIFLEMAVRDKKNLKKLKKSKKIKNQIRAVKRSINMLKHFSKDVKDIEKESKEMESIIQQGIKDRRLDIGTFKSDPYKEVITILTSGTNEITDYDYNIKEEKLMALSYEYFVTKSGKFDSEKAADELSVILGGKEENGYFVAWNGRNRDEDRQSAADTVLSVVARLYYRKKSQDNLPLKVNLVGHSHGGNVMIIAANLIEKVFGEEVTILNLITLEAPVRKDYQLQENLRKKINHIQTFSWKDIVQNIGYMDVGEGDYFSAVMYLIIGFFITAFDVLRVGPQSHKFEGEDVQNINIGPYHRFNKIASMRYKRLLDKVPEAKAKYHQTTRWIDFIEKFLAEEK